MKSLSEYIVESTDTFSYRFKYAGDIDMEHYEGFTKSLEQFDVETITELKKSPIMKDPFGFPGIENAEIYTAEITLRYPASSQQLLELARLQGCDPNRIRILDSQYDDSMQAELEATTEVSDKAKLEDTDLPATTPEQKDASDKYSEGFQDIVQNAANTKFEIAGDKTPKAKFNTDKEQGKDSPMTKVKRTSIKDMLK